MDKRIVFMVLFVFVLSCSDTNTVYNQVYLKLGETQFLYFYNQSEQYLCLNEEVSICQTKYSLTDLKTGGSCTYKDCDYSITFVHSFTPNDRLLIATTVDGSMNKILVEDDEEHKVLYVSNYYIDASPKNNYFISSSQYVGVCDISILATIFEDMLDKNILNELGIEIRIQIDFNSIAFNPDLCRFANLINCLYINGYFMDLKNKNAEVTERINLQCFTTIYSFDEAVINDSKF